MIQTDDERERYKAVFQDQFSEYKELSCSCQVTSPDFVGFTTCLSDGAMRKSPNFAQELKT